MAKDEDLTAAMGQVLDPMLLMQRVTDRTCELVASADGVMVGLVEGRGVTYVCGAGQCTPYLGTRVDLDTSLSGLAVRTGRILRSDDTAHDARVDAEACRRLSVASLVCIPLSRAHETLGVLAVNASLPHAFSDDDVAELSRMAEFVSVAVGSAWDLSRVSTKLLEVGRSAESTKVGAGCAGSPADTASRFVMSVLSPDTVTRIDARDRLRRVLDDPRALSMVFQPIVDLASDRVVAVEALARFDVAPSRPPDAWFDDAHQVGLGVEMEMLAVTRALAEHPLLPGGFAVTINVGPGTIRCPELFDALQDVPAERIVLELTEHTDVDDYPGVTKALQAQQARRSSRRASRTRMSWTPSVVSGCATRRATTSAGRLRFARSRSSSPSTACCRPALGATSTSHTGLGQPVRAGHSAAPTMACLWHRCRVTRSPMWRSWRGCS